jgi:flagellar hook assembly protein FlgD
MLAILEELFGLDSSGRGTGGQGGVRSRVTHVWRLSQNTPNPCVASTQIHFEVARTSDVAIKIYNATGQLVRVLVDRRMKPGPHFVQWGGTNEAGRKVSSGVYFYSMQAKGFSDTRKMLVLR